MTFSLSWGLEFKVPKGPDIEMEFFPAFQSVLETQSQRQSRTEIAQDTCFQRMLVVLSRTSSRAFMLRVWPLAWHCSKR